MGESVEHAAGGLGERAIDAAGNGNGWSAARGGLDPAGGTAGPIGGARGAATSDEGLRDEARGARAAQSAASVAGRVARHVGDAVEAAQNASAARSRHVEYELDVDGGEERWSVRSVVITESLSGTYEAVLRVRCDDTDVDVVDALLGRDASLLIDRREDHDRRLCGIVHRVVELGAREHHAEADVHLVPAFALLGHGTDSRVFQDKTAVQIVEEVLGLAFGPYGREVDASGLIGTYATREMCIQYRESHRDFVSRLLEEEGIGYFFDFDGDGHERMVLFDANQQLAAITTMDGNAVPFSSGARVIAGAEPIVRFEPAHRLTATAITVRDLDWTEPQYRAEATRDGEDLRGRARAVYDHGHGRSVTLHDFSPGGRYGGNDSDFQAQIRQELAIRDAHRFVGSSMLIGLRPGVTFEITGHPVPGVDGRYMALRVRHSSAAASEAERGGSAHGEDYHNVFECISHEQTTFVPDRDTPKPAIYGVQTAVVAGPQHGEPHTDEYGRIKVQFHWDREAIDPSRASAWVRLGQTWAGHDSSGMHTFLFIPRVGSEVIVTFLDGDPDRPLVTGAVYNATNLPPLALPGEATRSVIRTESLGGGGGHNELSFEDAGGREEVYLRAERNLRELVQHNHDTHVLNNHTNVVDGKDDETVGGDQWLRVKGAERRKWVENNEINEIQADRETDVFGNDTLRAHSDSITNVTNNLTLDVGGSYQAHVVGAQTWTVDGGSTLTVTGGLSQTVQSGGWTMTTTGNVSHTVTGGMIVRTSDGITLEARANVRVEATGDAVVRGRSITMAADTDVRATATGVVDVRSQGPITLNSADDIRLESPKSYFETIHAKIGAYTMATTLYGIKVDAALLKADEHVLKIGKGKIKLGDTSVANVVRSLTHLIG